MRLFLAIDLPTETKKQIMSQVSSLRKEYPACNWVDAENYHITVYFFGEVQKIDKIKERIERLTYDRTSFYLYSYGMDLFMKNKITLYTTFLRQKALEDIAERMYNHFTQDFPGERKFVPHLTVCRCRIPSKQQYFVLQKRIQRMSVDVEFPVKKLVLFESILNGKKPFYKSVASFPLLEAQ